MITYVWAEDQNGVIGLDGKLPWSLPADLKFFKDVTLTGDILMGRKTYEGLPNKPLPGRENIILTRNENYKREEEGVTVLNSIDEAMDYHESMNKTLHIIGGENIFIQFIDYVDVLYRTVVHDSFEGDTYIPDIDYSQFELVSTKEGPVDKKNKHPHTYMIYKRKSEMN